MPNAGEVLLQQSAVMPPEAPSAQNLTYNLIETARTSPQANALLLPDRALTYRQLDDAVWKFAKHLHEQGLRAGDTVGLVFANELNLVLTLLGGMRLGATAFSIPRSFTPTQRKYMAAQAKIKALATDKPGPFGLELQVPVLRVKPALIGAPDMQIDTGLLAETPEAPWQLITGSGTTGVPKLIPVTHGQTAARCRFATQALQITGTDRVTALSHMDFSFSKFRLLEALSMGAAFALQVWDHRDRLSRIRHHALSVVYGTVFHAEALLAGLPRNTRPALGNLRFFELSSSTVSENLRERFRRSLCPNLVLRYGINEVGPVSFAYPPEVCTVAGTVGRPLPGVQVELVDEQGCSVPSGVTGVVRIRSPGLVHGYRDNEAATRQFFHDGWFTPGDLGRFTPDGQLIYCGRSDHMMIMNGINIYPAEIERVMTTHPAVHDAAAMPIHHSVHQDVPVCAVTLHPGAKATELELLTWARDQLGSHGPHHVMIVEQIPRNHDGKLVRTALGELIARRLQGAGGRARPDLAIAKQTDAR